MLVRIQFHRALRHASIDAAKIIDGAISSDGQYPGTKGATLVNESLHPVPNAQKSFLRKILGHARIAYDAVNQGVDDAAVFVVKIRHRLRFTPLQPFGHRAVGLGIRHRKQNWKKDNHKSNSLINVPPTIVGRSARPLCM